MKKKLNFLFLALMALLCPNNVSAGNNLPATAQAKTGTETQVLFEEPFTQQESLNNFTVEGEKGSSGDPIWKFDEWGTQDCINAAMWSGTDKDIDSYLVSPVFRLGRNNTATFNHGTAFALTSGSYSDYFGFCIREKGSTTWEELVIPTFPKGDAKINCGEIVIPESYNGKDVQVAFRYHATKAMQMSWYINKLVVKGVPMSDSGKELAGIEFETDRINYVFGSTESFTAPKLKNPNNLEVTFSSSNTEVASVDAATGEVTIKAIGKTVIKAESKETEVFDAGVAQYTLNVVKTLEKADAGLEWDIKELNTTFPQPEGFQQPKLSNPNKRDVVYNTSNEGVAIIDASTGVIHIQGLGIATITATSAEDDEYKAGLARTTIISTDATKVLAASFALDMCNFTEEGTKGVWKWEDGCIKAAGKGLVTTSSECFLVSPEMTLGDNGNFLKFDHICSNFTNPEENAIVLVREVGTETWSPVGNMWYGKEGVEGFTTSGLVRILNEFNGKTVQLGFKYITDGNANAGEWSIRNLIITKTIVKKDAEISYDVESVSYAIGDGEFKAPVLNNPNNLKIEYMSDNYGVANIDRETGEVFISGVGTCTITARANETPEFKQGVAQYTLTVTDPYLIFRDKLNEVISGLGEFTEEGTAGCWTVSWGLASTIPWETGMKAGDSSILVSPKMTLGENSNTITFDQKLMFVNGTPEKYAELVIRTIGGEWEKVEITYPTTEETTHSGNIALPEKFCGKEVQIGFKYTRQEKVNNCDGTWTVNNIIVRNVSAQGNKADAELSFSAEEVTYEMESKEEFTVPVLNNPNNLEVSYESSNADVASVDNITGVVTINAVGEAIITAKSAETEKFAAGSASYKIIVTPSTGIDCINGIDLENNVIYDLQGRKVSNPGKGLYIINGKKVIIK